MYYLKLHYYIPYDEYTVFDQGHEVDADDNGIFEMYSDDHSKLIDIRDLISLDFLGKLSCYNYTLCMCEELRKKCDYCINTDKLPPVPRRNRPSYWNLQLKHDIKFLIDIYASNQTGCEVSVFLEDVYSGKLKSYYRTMMEKRNRLVEIPEIKYSITTVDSIPQNINKNYVYWNNYVHFDENFFREKVLTCRYDGNNILLFLNNLKNKF